MAATPDLHESFWVAMAAAAPVIGLASAVTAEQVVRRVERATEEAIRRNESLPPMTFSSMVIPFYNIVLQTLVLGLALICLALHFDSAPLRVTAVVGAIVGMALVFLPSYLGWGRQARKRLKVRFSTHALQVAPVDGNGPQSGGDS